MAEGIRLCSLPLRKNNYKQLIVVAAALIALPIRRPPA